MSDPIRISFTVPGPIRGKQRAGRMVLPGGKVRSFNPRQTARNEMLIRDYASLQMRGRTPFTGAMSLCIRLYKPHPVSWSKKRVRTSFWITGKPDCDNIAKLVADALNKIVWHDDAQIADLTVTRRFATTEYTQIEILPLEAV